MPIHHHRRGEGSCSHSVQSHEEARADQSSGNGKKRLIQICKSIRSEARAFHWQDGYGLFSVSPSHFDPVRKYILDQEEHHRKETFQEELLRILKTYSAKYD